MSSNKTFIDAIISEKKRLYLTHAKLLSKIAWPCEQ